MREKGRTDDEMLLDRVRKGENEAVALLYKRHYPVVYHYVINNHGDEDDATEIYQQAFIILYEKLRDPAFSLQSATGTFLYAVARNLWLASLKERRRFGGEASGILVQSDDHDEQRIQELVARERDYATMETSLELLGEPCRSLLKAFYHEMMSMEQIAETMGYTNADNAKNQKYKCLQRLKRLFEKQSASQTDEID
jgi:RNA polymerase sigma factor (sigma-70 family)